MTITIISKTRSKRPKCPVLGIACLLQNGADVSLLYNRLSPGQFLPLEKRLKYAEDMSNEPGALSMIEDGYAINVENLVKKYGSLIAVNDISFTVRKGEIFAFLGPNGAGKTTTVEVIEGIREPNSGKISVFGMDRIKQTHEIKKIIGVLPQEFNSFDRLTVKETIEYYGKMFDRWLDADELIKLVDLEDKRNEYYMNLSGGLKQRVGIAVALVSDPELVFLDEPTSGLDPKARRDIWKVIQGLKSQGKAVFLTTHYMEEAEKLADSVAIIHLGKIVAYGSPNELISKYGKKAALILKGCDKEVGPFLGRAGYEFKMDNRNEVRLPISDNDSILRLLDLLKKSGLHYSELAVERSNLEDVFLNLTGATLMEE